MKRIAFIALALGVIALLASLLLPKDVHKDRLRFALLGEQFNHVLSWSVRVYGIPNDAQLDDPFIGAEHIRIVDRCGSKYCIFRPSDQSGYSCTPRSVWSPSGHYLVLSDGQQEGFAIYQTAELPSAVPDRPCFRAKVVWEGGYSPFHQFDGWTKDGDLLFSGRAAGVTKQYRCNLDKREIILLSAEISEK